jgi:hypothetical protein
LTIEAIAVRTRRPLLENDEQNGRIGGVRRRDMTELVMTDLVVVSRRGIVATRRTKPPSRIKSRAGTQYEN